MNTPSKPKLTLKKRAVNELSREALDGVQGGVSDCGHTQGPGKGISRTCLDQPMAR